MTDLDAVTLNFSASNMVMVNAILAIVMFSIALDLRLSDFNRLLRAPRPVLTGLVAQFVLLPAVTYGLIVALQPQASVALGLILVAACPGGNISNFITHRAGGNAALSVSMTAFSTVGAIVITPLNLAFWGQLYAPAREILERVHIDPVQIAITVTLMLIFPLALGVFLNQCRPELTDRIRRPVQNLSMVIFVGFVALALAANWSLFLGNATYIGGLVIAHNALALATGYGAARLAGLSAYDRRAVTLETGIQNSGLGLVLIFGFFNGLGGMALVAGFWGIWHALSGLCLARLWAQRKAQQ